MKIQSKATNSQTIIAEDVAIDGNVINGPAELLKGCELVGNLKYKILTIEDGAQFSGRCDIIVDE